MIEQKTELIIRLKLSSQYRITPQSVGSRNSSSAIGELADSEKPYRICNMQCTSKCKLVTIGGLAGLAVISLIVIFLNKWDDNPVKSRTESTLAGTNSSKNINDIGGDVGLNEIQKVIDEKRRRVHADMADYPYPNGRYNISARKLEDLVIEENGNPIRSLILSTFRSGSSFFGEILGSHPGNFYHFESLSNFGILQIRGPPSAGKALDQLRALLNCEFENQDGLIGFERKFNYLFNRTTYLWERCKDGNNMCYDHRYLSKLCKLFPFQSMKLTRLRLRLAEELLTDEKLAVRIVLLVRDPRGTLQSLKHVFLHTKYPDCKDPVSLCADLVSDFEAAVEFKKKYPHTFRVIRYEDLAADPYNKAKELSEFYGRDFHQKVRKYLDTHTKTDEGSVFSTVRNTKKTPYHWRTYLDFEEVEEIQEACKTAMKYWGYLPAMNASHQREFNPVTNYDLNL